MNPRSRAEAVFYEALDLPPERREAHVRARCGGDPDLLGEVLSLLDSHRRSEGFLDGSAVAVVSEIVEAEDPTLGMQIGPFRVVRRIGVGGMGQVYLAERTEGDFTQHVAIKLIHRGYGEEALRRFRNECRVLAMLEHPHIARMIDGGFTSTGTPFIIMEYVDGTPIDEYCEKNELSLEQRLDLFRYVCAALEHAHRHSTIHRDIKPSNILVDRDGVVKIVDFGIARVLDAADGVDRERTATGMHMMTPLYASPEQLRGQALSTATDVYSLGVVLYKLLTRRAPFELRTGSAGEMLQVLESTHPTRPSEIVLRTPTGSGEERAAAPVSETRKEARKLKGDLDTIVLKSMRKEPERRYASVAQLSEDIHRFLRGHPVSAQPDTFGYRAGKFLRRHLAATIAGVVILLVLIASSIVSLRLYFRAEEQRRKAVVARQFAEQNERTADAVADFLTGLFAEVDPERTVEQGLSARDLLDRGAAHLREGFRKDRAIRARLLKTVGEVYANIAAPDSARPLLEEALRIEREIHGEPHPDLASTLRAYGDLLSTSGDHRGALTAYREALEVMTELYGPENRRLPPFMNRIALGSPSMALDERIAMFRRSLAIIEKEFGPDDPMVAYYLINLGGALRTAGRYQEALRVVQRSVEIREAALGPEHPLTLLSLSSTAATLNALERYAQAETLLRRVLTRREAIYGSDHLYVAMSLNGLANALMGQERYDEARPYFQRAIDIKTRLYGPMHPYNGYDEVGLGLSYVRAGDPETGLPHLQRAREILERAFGEEGTEVAFALSGLGEARAAMGDPEAAIASYTAALGLREGMGDHPLVDQTLRLRAKVLRAVGRSEEAEADEARVGVK